MEVWALNSVKGRIWCPGGIETQRLLSALETKSFNLHLGSSWPLPPGSTAAFRWRNQRNLQRIVYKSCTTLCWTPCLCVLKSDTVSSASTSVAVSASSDIQVAALISRCAARKCSHSLVKAMQLPWRCPLGWVSRKLTAVMVCSSELNAGFTALTLQEDPGIKKLTLLSLYTCGLFHGICYDLLSYVINQPVWKGHRFKLFLVQWIKIHPDIPKLQTGLSQSRVQLPPNLIVYHHIP